MLPTETREKLAQTEDRLRALRQEKARASNVADAAKAAAAGREDEASLTAAEAAVNAVKAIDSELEKVGGKQIDLLRSLGDAEAGLAGFASPGVNGWNEAAKALSLGDGNLRVDVAAATLLQPRIAPPLPVVPSTPTAAAPIGIHLLYPVFEGLPFGDAPADLAATDYTVTFSTMETGITGVEIPPATDTEKAVMPVDIGLATPTAKTFAVVAEQVPAKVFDSQASLRAFLSTEMARWLDEAYDAHVVSAIEGAGPSTGSPTGTTLVQKIRRAIAEHRELGGEPRYLALTPSDAAELDLSEDSSGRQIFRVDLEGSGNPVWSLLVRESRSVTDPLLVDPVRLGVSYLGEGGVLVDPFGANLRTNQVSVRVEVEARFHVRNIVQGAYAIS